MFNLLGVDLDSVDLVWIVLCVCLCVCKQHHPGLMIVKRLYIHPSLSLFLSLSLRLWTVKAHIIESHGSLMKCPASHSCFESMHSTHSNENKVLGHFYFNLPFVNKN